MSSGITHIWFRTRLSLRKIADNLKLTNITEDCENYWAWVIGDFSGVAIDICRAYVKPRLGVDVYVFRVDMGEFSDDMVTDLERELGEFIRRPIYSGCEQSKSSNRSKYVVVREFVRRPKSAQ